MSRSVWKQANVASDLWEKLTARCVDRHRSDTYYFYIVSVQVKCCSAVAGSRFMYFTDMLPVIYCNVLCTSSPTQFI